MSALEFDSVSYRFEGDRADTISKLSLRIEPASFHAILGVSGSGKSTLFRLITGLLTGYSGKISVDGRDITKEKSHIGYMPQKDLLFPWRKIGLNVALPMEIAGTKSKEEIKRAVSVALEDVGLAGLEDKYPDELSGGMRQRAAFARTMLTGSDLLLLDEPFSALDYLTRISMQEWLLNKWQESNKTILFITHDVEEAIFLSQSILVVENTPISSLRNVNVPLSYPRTRKDMTRPEIVNLKEELISLLRKEAGL